MSYVLILGAVLLGLFSLYKDWQNYRHPWLRRAVAVVLLMVGALSGIKQFRDFKVAQLREEQAASNITRLQGQVVGLNGQVKAANEAQSANTKLFLQNLNGLSDKLRALETQIKTEDLRKQLASVQGDLQRTQKALAPPPKATLVFTFHPLKDDVPYLVTDTSLSVDSRGSVHMEFMLGNFTEANALDGEITLYLCDGCRFAREPEGFRRLAGSSETERTMSFERIFAKSYLSPRSIDISPPAKADRFDVFFGYRCRTCISEMNLQKATIRLVQPHR